MNRAPHLSIGALHSIRALVRQSTENAVWLVNEIDAIAAATLARIEARSDETPQAAQPERREPDKLQNHSRGITPMTTHKLLPTIWKQALDTISGVRS
jgi:hypothetical protein